MLRLLAWVRRSCSQRWGTDEGGTGGSGAGDGSRPLSLSGHGGLGLEELHWWAEVDSANGRHAQLLHCIHGRGRGEPGSQGPEAWGGEQPPSQEGGLAAPFLSWPYILASDAHRVISGVSASPSCLVIHYYH